MNCKIKETRLTDGSKVYDLDLYPNSGAMSNPKCIFTCTSEKDALQFFYGLKELVEKYTVEYLKEA
jgi:hypothetical protein